MDSQRAFETLLAEVDATLAASMTGYEAAVTSGDSAAMEAEYERQRSLMDVIRQIRQLRDRWPEIVDKAEEVEPPVEDEEPRIPARLSEIPDEGLPIFGHHDDRRYDATLFRNRRVLMGHTRYGSPSGAGTEVCGYNVNGWHFWHYVGPDGFANPIDALR